ncbi:MAG TPA: hypothetical protein VJ934_13095 [Desulfomicrobiaceae bacterium]|nr:hypothetical protein [Desulfomicrobiaceae bacterium]
MRRFALLLVLCTVVALVGPGRCGTARAFFPDTSEVRRAVEKHCDGVRGYRADLSFAGFPSLLVQEQGGKEAWSRLTLSGSGSSRTVVAARLGSGRTVSEAFPASLAVPLPLVHLWTRPLTWWESRGLDSDVRSYGFAGDQGCLVLGGDQDPVQLWLAAETFVPVRAVFSGRFGRWQLTWEEIRQVGNLSLPHALRIQSGSAPELRGRIAWQQTGGETSLSVSPVSFRSAYAGVLPAADGDPVVSLVQRLPLLSDLP